MSWIPGPWIVNSTATRKLIASVTDESGRTVALVGAEDPDEANATAQLIASAPKLYEELVRCEQMVSADAGPPDWDRVRSVLAEARQWCLA